MNPASANIAVAVDLAFGRARDGRPMQKELRK